MAAAFLSMTQGFPNRRSLLALTPNKQKGTQGASAVLWYGRSSSAFASSVVKSSTYAKDRVENAHDAWNLNKMLIVGM